MGEMDIVPGPLPAPVDEKLRYVGRLRRWHRSKEWGFIFSEMHSCDVFFDGSGTDAAPRLSEGDLVLFELQNTADGPEAHNVRGAQPQELEQQQLILAPVYRQHAANAPEASEHPRNDGLGSLHASTGPPAGAGSSAWAAWEQAPAAEQAASPNNTLQHLDAWRRPPPPPPPPPPPSHAAPSSPGNFAVQALSNSGLMQHQQPFVTQPSYGSYQGYGPDRFNQSGMYSQSPWPNGEPMLGTSAMAMGSGPRPRLLLRSPTMLGCSDTKAMVEALKGNSWPGRRAQTFQSSGIAAQLGREWCDVVRQACQADAVGVDWQTAAAEVA